MHDIVVPQRALPGKGGAAAGEGGLVFDLLQAGAAAGLGRALVTLVEVEGGSSRPIGAQMAVLADGRYCGYLSGGCVEAAIAAEAVKCIVEGRDKLLRFGVGSPFFDIRLPCGGSIEIFIHVAPAPALVASVAQLLRQRVAFGLALLPSRGTARLLPVVAPSRRSGWHDEAFVCCFAPVTRLLLAGRGIELEQAARLGAVAGLEIVAVSPDEHSAAMVEAAGGTVLPLTAPGDVPALPIDPWTAVVLLFHDHDWEIGVLREALAARPFFIGAMGSPRAHQMRRERLLAAGVQQAAIDRIKGPVGLFGPTRDAVSLAVSILAEVTEQRRRLDAD